MPDYWKKDPTVSLGALNATVDLDPLGSGLMGIKITGTWTGVIVLEVTNETADGISYDSIIPVFSPDDGSILVSMGINGFYIGDVAGCSNARLRMSAWTSGTANVGVVGFPGVRDTDENYTVLVGTVTQNTAGTFTSNTNLKNFKNRGATFIFGVTAISGTIAAPQIQIGYTYAGTFYPINADFTKSGNLSLNQAITVLCYPGASGGNYDHVEACGLERDTTFRVIITLPPGASITYTKQVAYRR